MNSPVLNTEYRKTLASTSLDYFDTRAAVDAIQPYDQVITRGTQTYAQRGGRFAA